MGQWAKYMFVLPSKNLTVVSIGQSKGGSLDCTGAYNDGCASRPALPTSPMLATPALCTATVLAAMKMVAVPDDEHRWLCVGGRCPCPDTLSLIWRAMEASLGLGPKPIGMLRRPAPRSPEEHDALPDAPHLGSAHLARDGGRDRTRASIREDRAAHARSLAAMDPAERRGAACCTCVCPPEQGFGRAFNVPAAEAAKHPFTRNGGACPEAIIEMFPYSATQKCPAIGIVQQCDKSQVRAPWLPR
jgi:hypothetical protein